MNELSGITEEINYDLKYLSICVRPSEYSLYGAVGISILDSFSKDNDSKKSVIKLMIILENSIEYMPNYEKYYNNFVKYIKELYNTDILEDIKDTQLLEMITFSFTALFHYFSIVFPDQNPIMTVSTEFGINIEILENGTITAFCDKNIKDIRILKTSDLYYSLLLKKNPLLELYHLVSNFQGINVNLKKSLAKIVKNKYYKEKTCLEMVEEENWQCGHQQKLYKTLCGKLHCLYCLKEKNKRNTFKNSVCMCQLRISAKNYYEIAKL